MTKLKVVSNNKVRANRENAKKSTGPKTVKFSIQRKKLKRLILLMMIYMLTKRSVKLNVRHNLKRSERS